ncbi:MAG TPA: hypothetical protein DD412_03720 [Holosporales bacterium]|nr:hypothetical protein [Holosporales bacterium]
MEFNSDIIKAFSKKTPEEIDETLEAIMSTKNLNPSLYSSPSMKSDLTVALIGIPKEQIHAIDSNFKLLFFRKPHFRERLTALKYLAKKSPQEIDIISKTTAMLFGEKIPVFVRIFLYTVYFFSFRYALKNWEVSNIIESLAQKSISELNTIYKSADQMEI